MGNFEIQDPPIFQTEITKWSRETDADGDEMGRDMEKVFNNTIYNKAMIERERHVTEVLLTAVDWQEENRLYIQTISVPGTKEDMDPVCTVLWPMKRMRKPGKLMRKKLLELFHLAAESFGPGRPHLKLIKNQLQTVWWA